jgi:hypothetical protein
MTWLLGLLGYAAALALVLLLVGGVKRADALHARAAREARKAAREPAVPRPTEGPAIRVARILTGR